MDKLTTDDPDFRWSNILNADPVGDILANSYSMQYDIPLEEAHRVIRNDRAGGTDHGDFIPQVDHD